MPSIIACWCTKCDCFQEEGRSCVACGTLLSVLPLEATMRSLENCQGVLCAAAGRERRLKAEIAVLGERFFKLRNEMDQIHRSVKAYHKSSTKMKLRSSDSAKVHDDRTLRRFKRWNQNIAQERNYIEFRQARLQRELIKAGEETRSTTLDLNLLRVRIRRIVQVFQTHFSGVSQIILDELPRRVCTEEGLDCIFCTDNLNGETIVELPNCDHTMFHEGCALRWLGRHNSCPVCRAKVQTSEAVEIQL